MKLSVVIPVLNQFALADRVIKELLKNTDYITSQVEFLIIDNGSKEQLASIDNPYIRVIRNEKNIGVYPTFKQGFENTDGDIVAFFHSDLIVWEKDWNQRVMKEFENDPKLGMIGFIGSNEIDSAGGRGGGTTSNFKGLAITGEDETGHKVWLGSSAVAHGKEDCEFSRAAVVDGCAMIIRREAWNQIGYREDFPPHHFYDRLISTQLIEKDWHIGVLGVACDHFSGQTANQERDYHRYAREWTMKHINPTQWKDDGGQNWDLTLYQEAERQWLGEYRDKKHIVPIRI